MLTSLQLYTADDLLQMGSADRFELIKGELVPIPPSPGWLHGSATQRLASSVSPYVLNNDLGECFAAETGFRIDSNPDTVLAPDFSFVSRDRLPKSMPKGYLPFAPDIVAETRSPSDTDREVAYKIGLWLAHGAQVVWEIDPQVRTITVHKTGQPTVKLGVEDSLSEAALLPGWNVEVGSIFRW